MFAFADAPIKVVALLIMFAWCTVWSVAEITRSPSGVHRVSSILHLVMSLVMLLMVVPATWVPLRDTVTLPGMIVIFALSTAWFVYRAAVSGPGHRAHGWGHAAMFGAMTWHVSGMLIRHSAMMAGGGMEGHNHTGMSMASAPALLVAIVGAPFMGYLLISGLFELVRALRPGATPKVAPSALVHAGLAEADVAPPVHPNDEHGHPAGEPHGDGCVPEQAVPRTRRLGALSAAAMNLGMFWMSTGLMLPLTPWLDVLSV